MIYLPNSWSPRSGYHAVDHGGDHWMRILAGTKVSQGLNLVQCTECFAVAQKLLRRISQIAHAQPVSDPR